MTFESYFAALSPIEQNLLAERLHTLSSYIDGGRLAKAPTPHPEDCRRACAAMQLAEDYRILALIIRLHSPSNQNLHALRALSHMPDLLAFFYELRAELGPAFPTVVNRERLRELLPKAMIRQLLAAEGREPTDEAVLIEAAVTSGFRMRVNIETLHDLHREADAAAIWVQSAENCFQPNELWGVAGLRVARNGADAAKWRAETGWDTGYETLGCDQLAMSVGDEIRGWDAQDIPFSFTKFKNLKKTGSS